MEALRVDRNPGEPEGTTVPARETLPIPERGGDGLVPAIRGAQRRRGPRRPEEPAIRIWRWSPTPTAPRTLAVQLQHGHGLPLCACPGPAGACDAFWASHSFTFVIT